MKHLSSPLYGIRHSPDGWQVWSLILQYPILCGSPSDAKRIAAALEVAYPRGGPVDFAEVDSAIDSGNGHSVARMNLR